MCGQNGYPMSISTTKYPISYGKYVVLQTLKLPKISNLNMSSIWATTEKTFFGQISKLHPMPQQRQGHLAPPPLLSTCTKQHIKGLRIAIHNKVVHLVLQTLHCQQINTILCPCKRGKHQKPTSWFDHPRHVATMHTHATTTLANAWHIGGPKSKPITTNPNPHAHNTTTKIYILPQLVPINKHRKYDTLIMS